MPVTKHYLSHEAIHKALRVADLTEACDPVHAVRLMVKDLLAGLVRLGWPLAQVQKQPRIVPAHECHELLGYDVHAAAAMHAQTCWIDDHLILRTQTTSAIIAGLQAAASRRLAGEAVVVAAPGITFRRDVRDRWHCAEPHQMDIWVLGDPDLSNRRDLLRLVGDVLGIAVPGRAWVHVDSVHPYTEGGIEACLLNRQKPVAVLQAGCIARTLLQRLDIDPAVHGGLALSVGLDRLVMLRKGVPDIRLLRDAHPRVQAQMAHLKPWQPISRQVPISRDLSMAVEPGLNPETLTEQILQIADYRANWIEELSVKGRWPFDELPSPIIERLGIVRGQENLVLRVVLRDHAQTLTAPQAEGLYGDIQAALHRGAPGGSYRIGERL